MLPLPPSHEAPLPELPAPARPDESLRGEHRYAMLFQQAADAVFLFDEEGFVTLANDAAARMFRMLPRQLVGTNVRALLEPLQLQADPLHYTELGPGDVLLTQRIMQRADGTSFPAEINTVRLDDGTYQGLVRDVSERRRAEELREDQRRRLASLFESTPALLCTLRGPHHAVETANREFRQLLGERPLADRPLTEAVPEFSGGPLQQRLDEVLATGIAYTCQGSSEIFLPFSAARTGERYFDVVIQPVVEGDGSRSGVFIHAVDVSERVQSARERERLLDALASQHQGLRDVVEQMGVGVLVAEVPSGRIITVNAQLALSFGRPLTSGEPLPADAEWPAFTIDGQRMAPEEWPLVKAIREGVTTRAQVVRLPVPGADDRYLSLSAAPIHADDGRRIAAVLTAQDISEQQRAEDALRQSEARFRLVMERAADLIAILDADGIIRYASPSYAHGLGYELATVRGVSVFDLIHPDDLPRIRASWDRVRAGEVLREPAEFRARRSDGSWRSMSGVARNLLQEPAVNGVVVSWRDITEQREAEAQFRQAHKMEAIGRLAGGVAHDLNNILTVIQANAEFLRPAVPPDDLEELQEIGKATKRAAALTRQLLAFSRQQVLAPRLVDPNEVIENLGRMLTRLVGEDVEIALSLAPEVGRILVDPGQLEQVLMNLVVNARDAMPRGGVISIATARLIPAVAGGDDAEPPAARTAIVVADTGPGIPDEVRARMFEPFFTTKAPGLGTGLGLSTVLGIVEQSGGTIDVQSASGRGTTFTIQFPEVADVVAEWRAAPEGQVTASTTGAILVVEDDPSLRAVASRILRSRGYRVIEARDGVEALDVVGRRSPPVDLVLSDVVLPIIGGAELLRRLREADPTLPVVLVSGYTDDELLRRGVMAGKTRFIQKPYSADILHRAVEEALAAARRGRSQETAPAGKSR